MNNRSNKLPIAKRHLPVLLPLQGVERNANFLEKLIKKGTSSRNSSITGYVSANPNPILGTERENELKVIRETRLIQLDRSVNLIEQMQRPAGQVRAQNPNQSSLRIAKIGSSSPDMTLQPGINYDVATLILPLKNPITLPQTHRGAYQERITSQNIHQKYLDFKNDKNGMQKQQQQSGAKAGNLAGVLPTGTEVSHSRNRRGKSLESAISTTIAKRSDLNASTSMLEERNDTRIKKRNKNIKSHDEHNSSVDSKHMPQNFYQMPHYNVQQQQRTINNQKINNKNSRFRDATVDDYHHGKSNIVHKKQSVPVLINKCSSKHINMDLQGKLATNALHVTSDKNTTIEQAKSSQQVLSIAERRASVENKVSTQNQNSPNSAMRTVLKSFQGYEGENDLSPNQNLLRNINETAIANTILSSGDHFPKIKKIDQLRMTNFSDKRSSNIVNGNKAGAGMVRFAKNIYQVPNYLQNLTHTNFNQLDKFNQYKLLGVQFNERRSSHVQNRMIKTREETSNTIIQHQYPIMATKIARTLKTPKNPRVKIRLNRSNERQNTKTVIGPNNETTLDSSLLQPMQIKKLNAREKSPLFAGLNDNYRSRKEETDKSFIDHDWAQSRRNPFESSFSGVYKPQIEGKSGKSTKRKQAPSELFDNIDESFSGPSTDQNTFRGTLRGQNKFIFGQNLEIVSTTKHRDEQDTDAKTFQNISSQKSEQQQQFAKMAEIKARRVFEEPSISFNFRRKTKDNLAAAPGLAPIGLRTRWQTPINYNMPSTDLKSFHLSNQSSYDNYADKFTRNRAKKDANAKLDVSQLQKKVGGVTTHNIVVTTGSKLRKIQNDSYSPTNKQFIKNAFSGSRGTFNQWNASYRAKIEDIKQSFREIETINDIAGKMQDHIKTINAPYPADQHVNLSARSRVKLIDAIQQFRQESGTFGGINNQNGAYSRQNFNANGKENTEILVANSTERIQDSVTFEVNASDQQTFTTSARKQYNQNNSLHENTEATQRNAIAEGDKNPTALTNFTGHGETGGNATSRLREEDSLMMAVKQTNGASSNNVDRSSTVGNRFETKMLTDNSQKKDSEQMFEINDPNHGKSMQRDTMNTSIPIDEIGVHSFNSKHRDQQVPNLQRINGSQELKYLSQQNTGSKIKQIVVHSKQQRTVNQGGSDYVTTPSYTSQNHVVKPLKQQEIKRQHIKITSKNKKSPLRGNSLFTSKQISSNHSEARNLESMSRQEDNFFKNIENNPQIPLKDELDMQEQIRAFQKKIRQRAEEIKDVRKRQNQHHEVMGLLYQQNQKLKDVFQQLYNINLGDDFLSQNRMSVSPQQAWKQAISNTTFGESKLIAKECSPSSPKSAKKHHQEDQNLDLLLNPAKETHDTHSRNADQIDALGGDKDTLISNQLSLTASDLQKQFEAKKRQDQLQQIAKQFDQQNQRINQEAVNNFTFESKNRIGGVFATNGSPTTSSAHIVSYGLVPTDKNQIKIVDKNRQEFLRKNGILEHQIFNLYHNTINNTLQREKYQTAEYLVHIKGRLKIENDELAFLQNQNIHLRKVLQRYRNYVLNFKTEWKSDYLHVIQTKSKLGPKATGGYELLDQGRGMSQTNRVVSSILTQPENLTTRGLQSIQNRKKSNFIQNQNMLPAVSGASTMKNDDLNFNVLPTIEKLAGDLDFEEPHLADNDVVRSLAGGEDSPFNAKAASVMSNSFSPQKSAGGKQAFNIQGDSVDFPNQYGSFAQQLMISAKTSQNKPEELLLGKSPELRQPSLFSVAQSDKSAVYDKIDTEKVQNFCSKIKNTCKLEKPFDLILTLIDNIKQFIGTQKVMIVPIDPYLVRILTSKSLNSKERLSLIHHIEFIDSGSGLNKKLTCIAKSEEEKANTLIIDSISTYSEKEIFIEGSTVAIVIWHNKSDANPFMVIQCELSGSTNENQQQISSQPNYHCHQVDKTPQVQRNQVEKKPSVLSNQHSPAKQSKSKKINRLELLLLHLQCQGVQIKLEALLSIQKMRDDRLVLEQSIEMVKTIMRCDTLRGLARQMNTMLKEYLSFETINLMFKDPEKENLYTITFGDEDEQRMQMQKKLKQSTNEAEKQAIMDKISIQDFVLKASNMIIFPLHAGLTSTVYYQQKTIVLNNFSQQTGLFDYVNEIDNPKAIKNINNMLIGCLKREDGSTNGIVQLFNQNQNISNYDKRRFNALSGFFGGCIQKIEDKTRKLTTIVAAKMNYEQARTQVIECYESIANEGSIQAFMNLKKPFDYMDMELKRDQEDVYGKDGQPPTPQ